LAEFSNCFTNIDKKHRRFSIINTPSKDRVVNFNASKKYRCSNINYYNNFTDTADYSYGCDSIVHHYVHWLHFFKKNWPSEFTNVKERHIFYNSFFTAGPHNYQKIFKLSPKNFLVDAKCADKNEKNLKGSVNSKQIKNLQEIPCVLDRSLFDILYADDYK